MLVSVIFTAVFFQSKLNITLVLFFLNVKWKAFFTQFLCNVHAVHKQGNPYSLTLSARGVQCNYSSLFVCLSVPIY